MKKFIFLAICMFAVASVSAQGYYGPRHPRRVVRREPARRNNYVDDFYKVKVGATVGLNLSNTIDAYNSDFNTSTIAGLNAGLTLDVPLIYPLSFEPELLYSQKGYSTMTDDGKLTQRTHYIDVPLLAKFRVAPGFSFLIGPQLSFLMSTTNTFDNGTSLLQQSYDNRGDHSYIGGVLGVAIDINRNVELRGRYTVDLSENNTYDGSNIPDYRNQVWQIGLGFKFQ